MPEDKGLAIIEAKQRGIKLPPGLNAITSEEFARLVKAKSERDNEILAVSTQKVQGFLKAQGISITPKRGVFGTEKLTGTGLPATRPSLAESAIEGLEPAGMIAGGVAGSTIGQTVPGIAVGGTIGNYGAGAIAEVTGRERPTAFTTLPGFVGIETNEPTKSPLANAVLEELAFAGGAKVLSLGSRALSNIPIDTFKIKGRETFIPRPIRTFSNKLTAMLQQGKLDILSPETHASFKRLIELEKGGFPRGRKELFAPIGGKGGAAKPILNIATARRGREQKINFINAAMDELEEIVGFKFPRKAADQVELAGGVKVKDDSGKFVPLKRFTRQLFQKAETKRKLLRSAEGKEFKRLLEGVDNKPPLLPVEEFATGTMQKSKIVTPGGRSRTLFVPNAKPELIQGAMNVDRSVSVAKAISKDMLSKISRVPPAERATSQLVARFERIRATMEDFINNTKLIQNPDGSMSRLRGFNAIKEDLTELSKLDGFASDVRNLNNEQRLFRDFSSTLREDRNANIGRFGKEAVDTLKKANTLTARRHKLFPDDKFNQLENDPLSFMLSAMENPEKMRFFKAATRDQKSLQRAFLAQFLEDSVRIGEDDMIFDARFALQRMRTGKVPGVTQVLLGGPQNKRIRQNIQDILQIQAGQDFDDLMTGVVAATLRLGSATIMAADNITKGARPSQGLLMGISFGFRKLANDFFLNPKRAMAFRDLMENSPKHIPRARFFDALNGLRGSRVFLTRVNPETGEEQPWGSALWAGMPRTGDNWWETIKNDPKYQFVPATKDNPKALPIATHVQAP